MQCSVTPSASSLHYFPNTQRIQNNLDDACCTLFVFKENVKWDMDIDGHRRDIRVPTLGLWRLSAKVSKCSSIVQRCWHHVSWVLLIQRHSGHSHQSQALSPKMSGEKCGGKISRKVVEEFWILYHFIFLTRYHKREWVCFMIRFVSVNIGLKTKVLKNHFVA